MARNTATTGTGGLPEGATTNRFGMLIPKEVREAAAEGPSIEAILAEMDEEESA